MMRHELKVGDWVAVCDDKGRPLPCPLLIRRIDRKGRITAGVINAWARDADGNSAILEEKELHHFKIRAVFSSREEGLDRCWEAGVIWDRANFKVKELAYERDSAAIRYLRGEVT